MPDKVLPPTERPLPRQSGGDGGPARHQTRFADLIEGLDAIVWEMDVATWMFTYVSPRAEALLGYPVERWVTEPGFWSDVVLHPDDRGWAVEFCTDATRDARDHAFEYRARAADGRVVWLHDLVRVVRDEDGEARLLRGVMVDITAQKEAEAALRNREKHAELSAAVGTAVAEGGELRDILQRCAEAMVKHLDAAFARIWTLNEAEQMLELEASAGLYTHLDGPHGRVPVGAFKIGKIAAEKRPHLTNDVPNDPRVSDKEWARREGMVAFAGHPLLVSGRVVGVAALFARQPLSDSTLEALQGVAERLALVVERERTGRELRRRERQLAEAQALAHLGSWEWEVGSDTVLWSDELHRIFGVPVGTRVTYDAYVERLHPDDRDRVAASVATALERREPYQLEHRIVRPDGVVRHIASQGEVETDRHGRPVRLFGVAQDVTERREAAERAQELALEQLARSEAEAAQQKITGILESITDAFFALDPEWRFTYVNAEAERLLSRPAAELVGRSIWAEFPEAVGSTFEAMYRRATTERRTVEFREFFPPLDTWFEVRAFPAEEGLSVYFRDITDQHRAQEALAYQSYVTRTITENATAALFMMDEQGRCTYMNPAAEAMTGYTLDEIRDIPLHDAIHHHHPDGRPYPLPECPIDRALPEDFSIRAHADVFVRKNGEFFPVLCAASPIFRDEVAVGTVVEVRDVTEERRAERALRESEERFRSLIDATAAIVWTTPASGEFGGEQPQWSAFTGQRREEYQGWGWLDAVHPDDRALSATAWSHALENRSLYEVEHRLRRQDGAYRHMLVRAVPVLERDGSIREWVGIHTDITARKQMEQRHGFLAEAGGILASSLDYETTLRSVARLAVPWLGDWCAVDLLDEGGDVRRVDVAHRDPGKQELAEKLARLYPPRTDGSVGVPNVLRTGKAELVLEIPDALLEEVAVDAEHLQLLRQLGLRSYMVVPLVARGRILGAMSFASAESGRRYEPSDLATAEELGLRAGMAVENARLFQDLERAVQQIEFERSRLQEVFQRAPAVIALYSGPEHVITMVNPAWEEVVGKRDVVGKRFRDAFPELEGTGLYELLDQVYATGEPYVGSELKIPLIRDGSEHPRETFWNFVWHPITSADGTERQVFVHAVEVTDQVLARMEVEARAEEIRRVAHALERTNRELDQFAYVTSHDLKAPLRGIANLSQWIEEDLGDEVPEQTREHLQLLRGRVHRMEGLIEGILQFSRAGRVRDSIQEVDVRGLLAEVLDMLAPPEHVTVAIADGMPTLRTERLPLQQVFMNLIGNAIKYSNRPDARVEVAVRDGGPDLYEFSVADNGPGISPEYHERIFGIFQTLHARDEVEGTGIGLSLVQKIVESRGGRVWVESEEGAGATFRFLWRKQGTVESDAE